MNDIALKEKWKRLEKIRIRIMSNAYDLADRNDSEGYNSVKVMCDDVLSMIDDLIDSTVAAEREACAKVCELMYDYGWLDAKRCAREIRARREQ